MNQFKYKNVLAPFSFLLLNCGEAICQLVDTPRRESPVPILYEALRAPPVGWAWSYKEESQPVAKRKWGKAVPLQAWTGPEGSRKLRLPGFKTIDM
jgi:hypothetical protein